MEKVKRPGYFGRAILAWLVLNFITFGTLYAIVFVLGTYLHDLLTTWYVTGVLVFTAAITEYAIAIGTIVPVTKDWIKQEEYVKDGVSPSWEKSKT